MIRLRRADDGRGHARAMQQPCERNLRIRHAALRRDLADALDDVEIAVLVIHRMRELIALGARRLALVLAPAIAGKEAARQGAPRNDADAFRLAERHHLALLFA